MENSYFDLDKDNNYLTTVHLFNLGYREYLVTEVQTSRNARGQGRASRVLRGVCQQADKEEAILVLNASPDGSPKCLNYEELTSWYKRLGFEFVSSDEYIDIDRMVRYPKKVTYE